MSQGHRTPGKLIREAVDSGWGVLLSASHDCADPITDDYVIDNGAWTAHQSGEPWSEHDFVDALARWGWGAQWVAAPDIVEGGRASLDLSLSWLEEMLRHTTRVLIPVQDGVRPVDVVSYLGPRVGLFVGGSSEWKEQTARAWGDVAVRACCHLHVARVNTVRRITIARGAGADSIDGTAPLFGPVVLDRVNRALSQETLW